MLLDDATRTLFFSLPNHTFVGLINKETKRIVLAPCITKKFCLTLNSDKLATSGFFIDDDLNQIAAIDKSELEQMNELLKKNYLPRFASLSNFDEKSAHELLFEQQCEGTKKSTWGGFSIRLDDSDTLHYTFVSGAFNSPSRKRIKGAELSSELISEVKKQTANLVRTTKNTHHLEDTVVDITHTAAGALKRPSSTISPIPTLTSSYGAFFPYLNSKSRKTMDIQFAHTLGCIS